MLRGNVKELPYILSDIKANSEEDAIKQAKLAVAESEHWPRNMSIEERIDFLTVYRVSRNQ